MNFNFNKFYALILLLFIPFLIISAIIIPVLWYISIRGFMKTNNYLYLLLFVLSSAFAYFLYRISIGSERFSLSKRQHTLTKVNEMPHSSCTSCTGNDKLLPIMDPKFNLREVAKHLILLEDHLFHKGKRCPDCILKHCFTIDAFLDEGITLDKEMKYNDITVQSQDAFKKVSNMLEHDVKAQTLDNEACCGYAQQLRQIRKPLVQLTADMNLN